MLHLAQSSLALPGATNRAGYQVESPPAPFDARSLEVPPLRRRALGECHKDGVVFGCEGNPGCDTYGAQYECCEGYIAKYEGWDNDNKQNIFSCDPAPENPYKCPEGLGTKWAQEDWKVQGPNLGGWLVLEPWITPSLFYQFLSDQLDREDVTWDDQWGKDAAKHTGMDQYTFCQALGPKEGNKQLRRHWDAWVREEDIAAIAATGATHVRIPVGDWMYKPYGPYVGCTDGSLEQLERVLALLDKYGMKALLDIHAVRDSQNGFDNSGHGMDVRWGSEDQLVGFDVMTITTFQHWTIRAAHWMGKYDHETESYPVKNQSNIDFTLAVVEEMVKVHKDSPAIWGIEPVNEPWQFTPMAWLKEFYWQAYHIVRKAKPEWMFVMHDSFRGTPNAWWDFMKGCPNKALETHVYQAWNRPGVIGAYYTQACGFKKGVRVMEELVDMPFIVGEWSLATDNCCMWLNGFNDNLPGFPKVTCGMVQCAEPYMGVQPGAPPDPSLSLQGPYGTGVSGPQFGQCPVGFEWGDMEDEYMTKLTSKLLHSYTAGHGWFFWNFKNEMEPRWSFLEAHRRGWFPKDVSQWTEADSDAACPPNPDDGGGAQGFPAGTGGIALPPDSSAEVAKSVLASIATVAASPAASAGDKAAPAPATLAVLLLAFALVATLLVAVSLVRVLRARAAPAGRPLLEEDAADACSSYHRIEVPQ